MIGMRLALLLATASLVPVAAAATPRTAQQEPYLQLVGTIPITGQATVHRFEQVTAYGSGFCGRPACSDVVIRIDDRIAERGVKVSANGTFRAAVPVSEMPGRYTVRASQEAEGGATLSDFATLVVAIGDVGEPQGPSVALKVLNAEKGIFLASVRAQRSYRGKVAYLQRRKAGRWRIVKKIRFGPRSTRRFSARLPEGKSLVRMLVPKAGPRTRRGVSRTLVVRR
jgi:hypothetical protein